MTGEKKFMTGETYTLGELFSGNNRIIIPDLQRDYCWGNRENNLIDSFIQNLFEQYEKYKIKPGNKLNLGLIYGYETPKDHIQLCDGQQRITSLFILLGMLNKLSTNNTFRCFLISDFEYSQDDKEPYLNYAIRESSLYFLSDLVCEFFIKKNLPV